MSPETNQIPDVPIDLLRRYLVAHGWRVVKSPGRLPVSRGTDTSADTAARTFFQNRSVGKRNVDVYVLSEPGLDDIELILPQDRNASDFDLRLQGAIVTLSQVEDKDTDQIIASVRSFGFDVVQSRIPGALVVDDTIHLESARNYINCMKDLLATTATTEIRPLAFFGRMNKDAVAYSDRCRFGHTYRGSFGFTIESPVIPNTEETLFGLNSTPPFERRVVQRLAIGIQQVCQAVDLNDLEPLLKGFRSGFSANGCERFAALIHDTAYSGISFAFAFSPEWPVPDNLRPKEEFFVGPKHVDMARAAAQALRGEALEIPTDVYGTVVRLQNEADPSDISALTGEGEISVLHASEDYGDIHLRITLPPAEYLKAVEAHRLGRPVRLSGKLIHRGRYWYLLNPSDLTISYQTELDLE
jgi:hypothetical protein